MMRQFRKKAVRKRTWYPSLQYVINTNRWVIENVPRPKADRTHKLIRPATGIQNIIKEAQMSEEGLNDKASILFRGINKGHFFSGGNKSTGYLVACKFLFMNRGYIKLKENNRKTRKFIVGVREGRYSDSEIAGWLDE